MRVELGPVVGARRGRPNSSNRRRLALRRRFVYSIALHRIPSVSSVGLAPGATNADRR